MARAKRILIGGVPYGYDNLGDEAILACIVDGCRRVCPEAEITVLTGKPQETERRLGVRGIEFLLGEKRGQFAWSRDLVRAFRDTDLFIWGGANGLSDYPQMSLKTVLLAKVLGKKVMLYAVGFDPLRHQFHPNRPWKRWVSRAADTLLGRPGRFQSFYEDVRTGVIRLCLRVVCNRVDLITVRDSESGALLREYGVQRPPLKVTADPTTLLLDGEPDVRPLRALPPADGGGLIGVGISSQQAPPPAVQKGFAQALDYLVQKFGVRILFIPMNPQTDQVLMGEIRERMKEKKKAENLKGGITPEELLPTIRRTDLIISSRLHLLIMALVCNVPCVGLSRGGKIDNFLHRIGLEAAGDVREIDASRLRKACEQTWLDRTRIRERMWKALGDMREAARKNHVLLAALLNGGV